MPDPAPDASRSAGTGAAPAPPVLAVVRPSAFRRLTGLGALLGIGGFLLYAALAHPFVLPWTPLFGALGLGALAAAGGLRRATGLTLELTAEELRDSDGRLLARVASIERVDRGIHALRPSNGFLLRLREPGSRAWVPGLWWRWGRNVGVGGMSSPHDTRVMAEMVESLRAGFRPPS
jgi:hypothetical protein